MQINTKHPLAEQSHSDYVILGDVDKLAILNFIFISNKCGNN